jgi:predicted DNA-binding ribbon-helix-helix protein
MIPMPSGKRAALSLDHVTWRAIEHLASTEGVSWQAWCADVLLRHPSAVNMTAVVRAAATESLLMQAIAEERRALLNRHQSPLLALSATFNDEDFDADMATAAHIDGSVDYVGYSVITGADQFGRACLWLQNGLRGGPNAVIPLPFTPEQVQRALEVTT